MYLNNIPLYWSPIFQKVSNKKEHFQILSQMNKWKLLSFLTRDMYVFSGANLLATKIVRIACHSYVSVPYTFFMPAHNVT